MRLKIYSTLRYSNLNRFDSLSSSWFLITKTLISHASLGERNVTHKTNATHETTAHGTKRRVWLPVACSGRVPWGSEFGVTLAGLARG